MDLNRISHIIEKKLLEEDYTSLELAAALLRMNMGEGERGHHLRQPSGKIFLDDLDSRRDRGDRGNGRGRKDGKGRDGRNGRGRKNQDDADMARLFINIGKDQKVKTG